MKEIPEGKIQCEDCNGTGECAYSCCTGQIISDDIMMCPYCHEHLGTEPCESCNGTGMVDEDFEDFREKGPSLQAKAEMRADIARGH